MIKMNSRKLNEIISRFKNSNILVIGDIMIDEYIWGKVSRISPEAPVPVVNVISENLLLGGAANVVNNIKSLGGKVAISGVVGNDKIGKILRDMISDIGVDTEGIFYEDNRKTTVKTRIIAHNQQVVRLDREITNNMSPKTTEKILNYTRNHQNKLDAIIISDYGKGVISKDLMDGIIDITGKKGIIISVDPKVKNFSHYHDITIITPNHNEASEATGIEFNSKNFSKIGRILLKKTRSEYILITRGEEGMSLFEKRGNIYNIPTVAREVYDVTGAGDTVIATLTMALAVKADFLSAAILSNFAAGFVIGEVGTATITVRDLKNAVNNGIRKLSIKDE